MSACSVFGESGVEIAPYDIAEQDGPFEIRTYPRLILVTTPMRPGIDTDKDNSFGRLFDYISGANVSAEKIAMTAPVFMDDSDEANPQQSVGSNAPEQKGQKIAMTAPVFMDGGTQEKQTTSNQQTSPTMSFVLPASFTMQTAPRPTHKDVTLQEITDYKVAAIQFSGRLSDENSQHHENKLREWLAQRPAYTINGAALTAGYNPPWTIPAYRRNEVLIPITKK